MIKMSSCSVQSAMDQGILLLLPPKAKAFALKKTKYVQWAVKLRVLLVSVRVKAIMLWAWKLFTTVMTYYLQPKTVMANAYTLKTLELRTAQALVCVLSQLQDAMVL